MIDMVFLLLVFFMTVASVAKSQKVVELDLPESEESKIPEDASDRGILSVDAEGNFYIGDQIRSLEEVKAAISSSIRANPDLRVQVRADQNTEYEAVRKLLKTAACRICMLDCVAGCASILPFMAGAIMTGAGVARWIEVNKSGASP